MTRKSVIELPKVKATDVREEIARIAREEAKQLIILDHALDRQDQREITHRQILRVLKNGVQKGNVTWCIKKEKGWRCCLERISAGIRITVIAKLVSRDVNTCLVVSVWDNGDENVSL